MNSVLLLSMVAILSIAQNTKLEGKVLQYLNQDHVTDDSQLLVTLNYGEFSTQVQKNGIFTFHNVPLGKHFLSVVSKNFIYEAAFIEIFNTKGVISVNVNKIHPITRQKPQVNEKARRQPRDSLIFEIIQKIEYFEKEEDFNIYAIVKNQYFFMIAVTVGMLFLVKKMPMEELQNNSRAPVEKQ